MWQRWLRLPASHALLSLSVLIRWLPLLATGVLVKGSNLPPRLGAAISTHFDLQGWIETLNSNIPLRLGSVADGGSSLPDVAGVKGSTDQLIWAGLPASGTCYTPPRLGTITWLRLLKTAANHEPPRQQAISWFRLPAAGVHHTTLRLGANSWSGLPGVGACYLQVQGEPVIRILGCLCTHKLHDGICFSIPQSCLLPRLCGNAGSAIVGIMHQISSQL